MSNQKSKPAVFPLRAACIDTGSNAIRFLAAEFTDRERYTVLVNERASIRLGHGVFISGRLGAAAMDAAVAALAGFRRRMNEFAVSHYRAVATSAVRESTNGGAFVSRVKKEADVALEVISGPEEARLVHAAIRSRIDLGSRPWILADLGGGSVEVSLVDDTGMLWSESHTMGSVRLLEELSSADQDPGRFRRVLTEYVSTLKIPVAGSDDPPAGFIATGGNIEALAKLTGEPADARGVTVITLDHLQRVIDTLTKLSFKERVSRLGLKEDRADVILPAALVYERLAVLADAARLHVPGVGVKEGILLDLADDLSGHHRHEERLERDVLTAAVNLGRRFHFDENHARQVSRLVRSLFGQLSEIHELEFADRRLLLSAALLHDIGSYISRKKHHRHSQYVISNSDLSGLSPREMTVVAAVARFHRKGDPTPQHVAMTDLAPEEQRRVTAMAGLLRMADALDRDHRQSVTGVRVEIGKGTVVLEAKSDDELVLERVHFKRRSQLFARTFGVRVKIRAGAASKSKSVKLG